MTNVGYWMPVENEDNKLIYVLSHASKTAAEKSWKAFSADPEWKKAQKETEADGKIVNKIEKQFLTTTDYSPAVKPWPPARRARLRAAHLHGRNRAGWTTSTPGSAITPASCSRNTA